METNQVKKFLQTQYCILLLILCSLPELDLFSMLTGIETNIPLILCKLICSILILFILYKEKSKFSIMYIVMCGAGAAINLLSTIPNFIPDWIPYLALVLLTISIFIGKSAWDIHWKTNASEGAYLVLLAIVMHSFTFINDTMATKSMALVGLIIYLIGLGKLKQELDQQGVAGISNIKIAVLLSIVAGVLAWIPLVGGTISTIILIVAFILEFIGYGKIKLSKSVGMEGANGASMLRNSMIVFFTAALLSFISDNVAGITAIIALIMVFSGWTQLLFGIEYKDKISSSI